MSSLSVPGDLGTKLIRASGAGGGEPARELVSFINAVAHALDVPLAGTSIAIGDRLWTGPTVGVPAGWCPADAHFCRTVIASDRPVAASNTLAEGNWSNDAFVTACGVRSYLGVPLRQHGRAVGTLWIADRRARVYTPEHERTLVALADAFLAEVASLQQPRGVVQGGAVAGKVGFFEADLRSNTATVSGSIFQGVSDAPTPIADLLLKLSQPAARVAVESLMETIRDADGQFQQVVVLPDASGVTHAFAVNGVTERDSEGAAVRVCGTAVEISELHEQHRDTHELARKLELATAAASIGVWDWDIVSNLATFNRAWLDMHGLQECSLGLDQWLELIHPEDRAGVQEAHAAALAGERDLSISFRIRDAGGAERRIKATGVVLRDESGRAIRMIGTNIDVTAELEKAELLAVTTERLSLAVDASGAGVWDHDLRTQTTVWDAQMFAIFGRKDPRPPSREQWLNYVHPEDQAIAQSCCTAEPRQGMSRSLRYRIIRDDGTIRHVEVHATRRRDTRGDVVRCTGVARDITEQVEQSVRRESTRHFLEQTGMLARIGGWMYDAVHNTLHWSDQVKRIHEVPLDFVPTVEIAISFYPGAALDTIRSLFTAALQHRRPFRVELPFRTAQGRDLWIRTIGEPVIEDDRVVRVVGAFQDITDEHEAANRLRLITESMEDWVALMRADGARLYVSPSFYRATGWTDHDLELAPLDARVHPDHIEIVRAARAAILAGSPQTVRYRYLRKDGTYMWIECRSTPIFDDRGVVSMYSFSARDVSREQSTIEELRASQERFRLLADYTSDWVGITAIDGTPIYDSPSFFRLSGWTEQEIRSQPMASRIHPDDLKIVEDHLRTLASGEPSKVRYRYRIRNGSYLWRDCHSVPVKDEQGRVNRYVWSSRDITAETEAADALRASERNYRLLADHSQDWVGLNTADGESVYISPSFFRASGWTEHDIRTMPRESRYHPEDAHLIRDNIAVVNAGRENRYLHRYLFKNGQYRWMECLSSPITDANGVVTHYTWTSRDIHEQVIASEARRESDERYRLLADYSQDWVGLTRIDGVCLYNSPSFYRTSGWTDEDLSVRPRETRLHPDDLPALAKNFEVLRRGERSRLRHRYLFKDGTYHWMDCVSSPILDHEGKPTCYVWTSRDITLEMETLHALRASEERYRLLAENTDDLVGASNETGAMTYVSPSAARILGWTAAEILAKDWRSRVHPEDRDHVERNELDVRAGHRTSIRYRTRHKAGHYVWLELRSFPIKNDAGRVTRVIWTARDISAQVRATRWDQSRAAVLEMITGGSDLAAILDALVVSVERCLTGIRASIGMIHRQGENEWLSLEFGPSLPSGILEWGSQRFPITPDSGSCGPAILQRRRHVIEDIETSNNFGPDNTFLVANGLRAVWSEPVFTTSGEPLGTFVIFRAQPGQPEATELTLVTEAAKLAAVAIENRRAQSLMEQTLHDLASARDALTQQTAALKQRNDELAAAHAESERLRNRAEEDARAAVELRHRADAASRAKSDFLANMSHEIRTPMTAILGFADLLAEQRGSDSGRSPDEMAGSIRRNAEHLLTVINDVLDLSKIEAGKLQIESVPCSPRQIIQDVLSLLGPKAAEKGLTLSLTSGKMVPDWITSDPTRLRQIAVNLIGNAIKFTPSGGIEVGLEFSPPLPGMNRGVLRLAVKDSGIGLSDEQRELIFEVFRQADTSTTRRFGGTGLGLAISRRLARLMGGDIQVDSTLGLGSTFTLSITAPVAERPILTIAPGAADAYHLTGRILIAEDGEDNQQLLRHYLSRARAEFEFVTDGKQAIDRAMSEAAKGTPFDVILMDMQMPVLDGYTAVRLLRDNGYKLPIAALTANVLHEQRQRAIASGCDDFIGKPFDRKKLFEICRRLIERSKELRGVAANS
ncbi:MAG TPA: PAS domain-containing protein [Phycisphaerales bacterium]